MPVFSGFAREHGLNLLPPSLVDPAAAAAATTNSRDRQAAVARLPHAYKVLRMFAGLPYAGSYARGTGGRAIKKSGLAELHRGEIVTPSPTGPYGSQLRSPQVTVRPQVHVTIEGDQGALTGRIRAEIDGRSAPVVSQKIGRRQRAISSAPGQTRARFAR